MGYFKNIYFQNFRNFEKLFFEFDSACNIILGKNGSGKTNLLEGLSLQEKGRGFKKENIDNLTNFQNKKIGFNLQSCFKNDDLTFDINIKNSEKNFKKISVNNNYDKDSINHFESLFSIIFFLPEMERLFTLTPSLRRNFLDRLIYNYDKNYNIIVNEYKKSITERQLLLKNNDYDVNWIERLELNIAKFGSIIYAKRLSHIKNINIIIKNLIINSEIYEDFELSLRDDFLHSNMNILLNSSFYSSLLKKNRKIDFLSGRCLVGPHRSDLQGININNNFNLNQLSTGQQKTMVLLIIIAQSKFLIDNSNLKPIILLDEVCSHLDNVNRDLLLYLVDALKVQVFMTGTEENFFSFLSTKANYCNIQQ